MTTNDFLRSIDDRLARIELRLEGKLDSLDSRVDELEAIEDRRRGGMKVFLIMVTAMSTLAGWLGSYLPFLKG